MFSLRSYSEAGNKEKSNQANLLYGKWPRLQKKVQSGTNSWMGWRVKVRRNSSPWSGMGTLDCWAFLPGPAQHDSDELRLRARSCGPAAPSEAGLCQAGASSGLARPWPGAAGGLCSCGRALLLSTGGPVPLATPYLLCSRHPHRVRHRANREPARGRPDCGTPEEGSRKAVVSPRCLHHMLPQASTRVVQTTDHKHEVPGGEMLQQQTSCHSHVRRL